MIHRVRDYLLLGVITTREKSEISLGRKPMAPVLGEEVKFDTKISVRDTILTRHEFIQ